MTARHLATILVPFERLSGRALRDDQILIEEGDRSLEPEIRAQSIAPLRIVADNLRSAFNVGAILRTAECFGVEHVSLSGYTPTPETDKTARTSLGTEKSVSWSSDANVHEVIRKAKSDGYRIVALETAASAVSLDDFVWPEKTVLLLGNERFGLDRDVLDEADELVKIPMYGMKNSLNVGIACGVALASWRGQLEKRSADITYSSIGIFRSKSVHPYEAPRQAVLDKSENESVIELNANADFTSALKDLDGFDRVWLIYDFHHNENWKPLVLPPRGPHIKRGVFATRSPYRPNSIGLSAVKLLRIHGNKLYVRSTDLLDGTPILDIKPYVAYADSFPDAKLGWLDGLESEKRDVAFAKAAEEKLSWLSENGAVNLRGFLQAQLEFDPTDSDRKRVTARADHFTLAYRTWRADFHVRENKVEVSNVTSGYSPQELEARSEDKYGDKDLHRRFIARFK